MFDPKKYDTRMRDPEGKRKKPPVEERRRHLHKEATLRTRSEERFDEKRAEEPLPKLEKPGAGRGSSRTWWRVAVFGLLVLIVWRFAVGEVGQGLVLLILCALGFFWVGTRRGRVAPRRAPAPTPPPPTPPPRPGVARPARRRPVAPKPTRARQRGVGEKISAWVIFGALSTLVTSATGITKACKPDASPQRHRTTQVPELPTMPASPFRGASNRWQTHLPTAAPDRISGAVLFAGGYPVPHVRLALVPTHGPTLRGETDEHGIFVFDRIQAPTATLEVRGNVHLGASRPPTVSLPTGTRSGVITLHPQRTILLKLDDVGGVRRGEASVQVAETNGPTSGHGTWNLGRRAALVTGLAATAYYDVLVQSPRSRRADLLERIASGQQVVVSFRRSTTVHGRILLPLGAVPNDVEVALNHGRLRVEARVSGFGWQADHLPWGSWWDVTARRKGHAGAREAVQAGIHVGDENAIVLDLR